MSRLQWQSRYTLASLDKHLTTSPLKNQFWVFPFSLLFLALTFFSLLLTPGKALAQDANNLLPLRPLLEQTPAKLQLTLTDAVEIAVKKFPSISQAQLETQKTGHGVTLARTEYLPRMDVLLQELRATQNVTNGTILPQFLNVVPIQSGTPRNSSTFSSIFGSNFGVNLSWELIDFGKRAANVRLAKQSYSKSSAQEQLTRLDVALKAANSYLALLMAEQQILACQATLERMQDWALVVHTLCDKGLRPGVDAARADGEVSLSKIALIRAYRDAELANEDLAESIGMAGGSIKTVSTTLVSRPKNSSYFLTANLESLKRHPLAVLRRTDVDLSRASLRLLEKTWYPHLWYESAIWGRGSGDGQIVKPLADGIIPKTANWGVGFTLQFPVMQYYKVRAEKLIERSAIAARQASYDVAMQELIKGDGKARVLLRRAEEIADETPVLVKAARENQTKARERYRVGLTNVIEVAEAERMLARAQVEDADAQLRVWQAILVIAYAHGDLKPFLNLVASAEAGK